MTIDEWNGTVAIDVEDILRCLFEALAIRYISMAPFLTSRVSLLSLSDKSTGDVLGHAGDVRRGLRHWVFLFVELHVEGPHSAFYGWWTLVGWSGMRYMLLRPRLWGLKSFKMGSRGAVCARGGVVSEHRARAFQNPFCLSLER